MSRVSLLSLVSAALVVLGSPLPETAGAVTLPLHRAVAPKGAALARRAGDGTLTTPIEDDVDGFYSHIQIGTPPQSLEVLVDTGSSDLWVYTPASGDPYDGGTYNSSASSSYQLVKKGGFSGQYADGSTATGDVGTETISFAGSTLQNFTFGTVDKNNGVPTSVLGVALADVEGISPAYPNFPQQLKNSGYVARNAYSLYAGSTEAPESGNIVFGGIDTAKYSDRLNPVPIKGGEFEIDVDFFGGTLTGVLDTGTSGLWLPGWWFNSALSAVQSGVPGLLSSGNGRFRVYDISTVPEDKGLTFTINGIDYLLPFRQLFAHDGGSWQLQLYQAHAAPGSNFALLGDPLLRALYIVYDADGSKVAVAQAKYTDETNVVPIPANGIPYQLTIGPK